MQGLAYMLHAGHAACTVMALPVHCLGSEKV